MNTFIIDATPAPMPEHTIDHGGRTWASDGAGLYDVSIWPDHGVTLEDGLVGYRWLTAADVPTFDDMMRSMFSAPTLDVVAVWRIQGDAVILRGSNLYAFAVRFAPVIASSQIEIVGIWGLTCARCSVNGRVVALLASMRSKVEGS